MTEPMPDNALRQARDLDHDTLVHTFETKVRPALEERLDRARNDPGEALAMLRDGVEACAAVADPVPEIARLRMKLGAGIVECMLMARLPHLHRMFPDPQEALAVPGLARAVAGVGSNELAAAGDMLGAAILAAVRDMVPEIEGLDVGGWVYVLSCLLVPNRQILPNDNVVELAPAQAAAAIRKGLTFEGSDDVT